MIIRGGMKFWASVAATGLVITTACNAQRGERVSIECRQEVVKLCGLTRDPEILRNCLSTKNDQLSKSCYEEIAARFGKVQNDAERAAQPKFEAQAKALGAVEHSYGSDPLQKLDFYAADAAAGEVPPLVVFVHGGGWKRGNKANATGSSKIKHFHESGYAFASINYPLVPDAKVEQQAADVAASVAYLRTNAAKLGFDPNRIVLMGHSAGAHLVALVGTDPQYLRAAGLDFSAIKGVIPLDGAAYDVPSQMVEGEKIMNSTYVQAFGTDPARQKALSPYWHADGPNAPAFLILHVERKDGTAQSKLLGEALRKAGTQVEVQGFAGKGLQGHMEINRKLGEADYPATAVVDAWLKRVFG